MADKPQFKRCPEHLICSWSVPWIHEVLGVSARLVMTVRRSFGSITVIEARNSRRACLISHNQDRQGRQSGIALEVSGFLHLRTWPKSSALRRFDV